MLRKDCDHIGYGDARRRGGPTARRAVVIGLIGVTMMSSAKTAEAGSVRLWATAVVVDDTVRLGDLCELRAFDADAERRLAALTITDAPPPAGSRIVHSNTVRAALRAGGANMADVTLRGAVECAVTRPSVAQPPTAVRTGDGAGIRNADHAGAAAGLRRTSAETIGSATYGRRTGEAGAGETLRDAVIRHFRAELRRYGGRPEVQFDHTSDQVLSLSGPIYTFRVRGGGKKPLGLCSLEVDVLAGGSTVQKIPLVVQVRMLRKVVVARRPINQGATIQAQDVDHVALAFTRLDELGAGDPSLVIGQRAKRFISAGNVVDPEELESVPLVLRGQLVTLESIAGAVRIVTTAKATRDGLLGEIVTVRAVENKRIEFDALVVAPGRVQIGGPTVTAAQVAMGGGS